MTRKELKEQIEQVLHLAGCQQHDAGWNEAKQGKEPNLNAIEEKEADTLDGVMQLFDTYMKEVIGEDEEPGRIFGPGMPSFQRDRLRTEQRKRAGLEE